MVWIPFGKIALSAVEPARARYTDAIHDMD